MRPRLSLQTRRAPWSSVGGGTTTESPVRRSMRAMNEPAREHHQTSPVGVAQMPYGPRPLGASRRLTAPVLSATLPTTPLWPVNQRSPSPSKAQVFRFAYGVSGGSAKIRCSRLGQATRTIAFWPLSVIQAA